MSHPPMYLDPHAGATRELPLLGGTVHDRPQVGALTLLHRLLRGRYLLVIILGSLGAVAGGVGGYLSQEPLFRCEGQVQVLTPQVVFRPTPETQPMNERQVNTQAAFLSSERVVAAAMNSDEWRATGRGRDPQTERKFRESLQVIANRDNAELIRVSFTDPAAPVARAAIDAVLNAYDEIFVKGAQTSEEEFKVRTLDEERKKLDTDIASIQTQIQALASEYATEDLSMLLQSRLTQQVQREQDLAAFRREVALREVGPKIPGPPGGGAAESPATSLSNEEIAVLYPRMRLLLEHRSELEGMITTQLQTVKEEHRTVKQLRSELAALDKNIALEATKFIEGRAVPNADIANQTRAMSTDQLKAALVREEADFNDWREKTIQLGNTKFKLDDLRHRKAQLQSDLQSIEERRKELRIQAGNRGEGQQRIRIYKPVDTPSLAAVDRRVRMGIMGLVGGAGLPIGLIALWGLWQHKNKFTYSDEARERGPQAALLGILPQLPRDLADPEQGAAAAHCVHQMRTLLQIGGENRKVFAITSSTAGDGKTSLALSLGMSFAASGTRTLLIDFDMIGRGLSSALKCRPDHGLAAALENGSMNGSIISTGIERLSLLPAGRDDERFVSRLAGPIVRELIESARAQYDIVIIDTGPILGSLEANFVSSEADAVVLVVGRGQQRAYVDRAFEQLHTLGARVAGMVFNRASTTDFMQSATSTSFRSVRHDPIPPVDPNDVPDYEPIARTVALDIRR